MARTFHPLIEHLSPVTELPVPWYVAGGWAIDLFVDRVTRDHQDVDLVIARDDQRAAFEHLPDRTWSKIVPHPEGLSGRGTIEPWDGEPLSRPTHQILADSGYGFRIEFLLSEFDGGLWRSRRNPEVRMPVETMGRTTVDGIRYITPEIVLLYKAKHLRDWDEADFATALPEMTLAQRHWLFHALEAQHPGHPWTTRLGVS
jgi:hypothetical protein